ncbi:uncharacterized protein BT62DRAFT_1012802 [Guyanagaster necrorhizus]|uniref:Uncharacterized protein n=1 Tax=Guyanagaster necrorhizus TaxID=856835 RepID=A0A9P7VGU7_9AGAR|nr:uncharacterized protein BT62DRAFT_1012802 [Guyanagaster necrorhizus MCA 3950]KAG7440305.1 hypothetical protein BT62DRAFT_1012802 [Guyanagaster necrorhizus MCA 3950]
MIDNDSRLEWSWAGDVFLGYSTCIVCRQVVDATRLFKPTYSWGSSDATQRENDVSLLIPNTSTPDRSFMHQASIPNLLENAFSGVPSPIYLAQGSPRCRSHDNQSFVTYFRFPPSVEEGWDGLERGPHRVRCVPVYLTPEREPNPPLHPDLVSRFA